MRNIQAKSLQYLLYNSKALIKIAAYTPTIICLKHVVPKCCSASTALRTRISSSNTTLTTKNSTCNTEYVCPLCPGLCPLIIQRNMMPSRWSVNRRYLDQLSSITSLRCHGSSALSVTIENCCCQTLHHKLSLENILMIIFRPKLLERAKKSYFSMDLLLLLLRKVSKQNDVTYTCS
jgi:hypothetical protein